jgi:amino acid adenylation domain-containing protein/thioester reductase-like protein
VYELIQERCQAQPGASAVCAWDGELTYKALDDISSTLAVHLMGLGVGPETFVPLCFEKSRWIVVAMVAVMKAGGAFVLLDPSHPLGRLQRICQNTSGRLIVASTSNAALAAELADQVIVVGDGEVALNCTNHSWTPSNVAPENALYAVFTSGSTGTPKGVVIEHASFLSTVTPYSKALLLNQETRVFQFSSYAFDVSIFDTLITLINGGCVCVPSDTDRWSDVTTAIARFQASHASLTPTVARILQPADLPTLRTVVLGGEKLAATDVDRWVDHVRLVSLYGASECPLMSIQSNVKNDGRLCHIDHPIGSVAWVVDSQDHDKLVPIGAVGELLIEGAAVGRGYLNDPERTAASFLSPPEWLREFRGPACHGRVYKTGDLVQYVGDGSLRYVGRKDTQVKLRGQRVELGEVEHHVRECFSCAQDVVAEVVTFPHYGQAPMLVAFVVYEYESSDKRSDNNNSNNSDSILAEPSDWFGSAIAQARALLHASVPNYMVPAVFLPLNITPLTPTDKADRRRLRELAAKLSRQRLESFSTKDGSKRVPLTEVEKTLQHYYAEVLNLPVEQVSADDHLFHRGGDSLTAMKLVAMARKSNHQITVQDVFDCPRLSALASRVEFGGVSEEYTTVPFSLVHDRDIQTIIKRAATQCQVPPEAIEDVYPCTPLQEGMMALTEQNLGASFIANLAYNIPSHIDLQELEAAWNAVAKANPILRTRVILSDTYGMLQVVIRERLQWIVSRYTDIADFHGGIGTPLVRFVVSPGQQGSQLLISIHHAIYDGWALPLILAEVEEAFHGRSLSTHPFSPFIRYLQSLDGYEHYWHSSLAGLETPAFPRLPAGYQPMPTAVTELRESVGNPVTRAYTQSTYLRLAWAMTQAQHQESRDVFFGAVVSGRNAPIAGIESLTAPTVATIPCRVTLDVALPVKNALQQVQEDALAAIPFEQTGLQHIRRFGPAAARACSFQTLFVIQPAGDQRPFSLLTPIDSVVDHQSSATYAITVYCSLQGDILSITAVYDTIVVNEGDMQRILKDFAQVLRRVHEDPESPIQDILIEPSRSISRSGPLLEDSYGLERVDMDDVAVISYPPLPSATYQPSPSALLVHHVELETNTQSRFSIETLTLAAWGMLQARYAEAPKSVFGYTYNGGVPMPVTVQAQWNCTTYEYLNEVRSRYTGRSCQPPGKPSITSSRDGVLSEFCRFQTLLAIYKGAPIGSTTPPSWEKRVLSLMVAIQGNDVDIQVHFDDNLLHRQQVLRMIFQLEHVISKLKTESHIMLANIELASPQDMRDVLRWNQDIPDRVENTIHSLILEQAGSRPDDPAICSWDGKMTYRELDEVSSKLAGYLMDIGVAAESFVPLCFEKSMWSIVAMLAVMKAGGAFVPLDMSAPLSRLKIVIEEVRAAVILGSQDQYAKYRDLAPQTVVVCSELNALIAEKPTQLPLTVTSANAAYAIFTSGSTGVPKGVVVEHRAFCTASLAFRDVLRVKDRVLQFASYAFDVSMAEIMSTLIYGGCVCVPSDEDRRGNISSVITRMEVNWAMLTPSFANTIDPLTVPTLQTLCLAGEPMSLAHVERWGPRLELVNAYGPAECSVICVATRERVTLSSNPRSIGTAVGGACWLVDVDNHERLAPVGAAAELLIEGPNVARGYLNQPEKTTAAFIPRPAWFPFDRDARLYKTGDLVRYLPDGSILYLGRRDTQVKVRGQRVELGEIEHQVVSAAEGRVSLALVSYPTVGVFADRLTAIMELAQCDHQEYTSLIPVSIARLQNMGFDATTIAQRVSEVLPAHMVPVAWVVVEKLPTLLSGKLDRKTVKHWLASLPSGFQPTLGDGIQDARELPVLRADEAVALAVSRQISTLVSRGDATLRATLDGREFTVASTGLDSIQVISLVNFLKKMYMTNVPVRKLLDGKTTVRGVAALVTGGTDRQEDFGFLDVMQEVSRLVTSICAEPSQATTPGRTVFVTGVTGFLGTQVLRQLCARPDVDRVIVHVRASTTEHALERCREAAIRAQWWTESCFSKIEAWPGDIALPRLGLSTEQWAYLTGTGSGTYIVHAIIHVGAAVNWNAGYDVLRAANVDSTVDLVQAALMNPAHPRLVYVSGGHTWDPNDDDSSLALQLSSSNGYSQSKFVAEMVVKHFADKSPRQGQFSIIKPGLIIGTPEEGVANADDYLWRLAAAAVDIQAYNADCDKAWLTVTSSARVAEETVKNALCTSSSTESVVYITDGVTVSEFWSLLRDRFQYPLLPLSRDSWILKMQQSIDGREENHPLWPVKEIFNEMQGRLGTERAAVIDVEHRKGHVKAAICKSIEFLVDVGFIASATGDRAVFVADKVFQRTGNVWGAVATAQ